MPLLQPKHRLHRALIEALDALCAPEVRDRIVGLAAIIGDRGTVPTEVYAFSDFVRGPLQRAARDVLGDDGADTLVEQLTPIVMTASSGSRRTGSARAVDPDLVLVVQAQGPWRLTLVSAIRGGGYEVASCEDAMEANAVIAKYRPGVVVVDRDLAGISAVQLAKMVRRAYGEHAPAFVTVSQNDALDGARLLALIAASRPRAQAL